MKTISLLSLCAAMSLVGVACFSTQGQAATADQAPRILTQPGAVNIGIGSPLLLRVEVQSDYPLRFQWYRDDLLIPGGTNQEFGVSRAGPLEAGLYRLEVANARGTVQSEPIRVQVQPVSLLLESVTNSDQVKPGNPVLLQPTVKGVPPFTYEWLKDGTNYSHAPVLAFPEFGPNESGAYQLIIRNASGAVTSEVFSISYELDQEPLRLALERVGDHLELGYSFGVGPGYLTIYAAEDPVTFIGQQSLLEQPIPGQGAGHVPLPDTSLNSHQFFKAVIYGASTNPAPERWSTLPTGGFVMGSPDTEADRQSDEGPAVRIELSQPVFMGRWEVTQAEYLEVMGFNPSAAKGDLTLPVEQVSWEEATNYCSQLTQREHLAKRLPPGYEYRLPTEAEWEYAARAGSSNRFCFGDDPLLADLGQYAWFLVNSGEVPHPVGTRQPNAGGLYDMHGNVAEWCWDFYGSLPARSTKDPQGPRYGSEHVIRGGSFADEGEYLRSAFRYFDWSTNRFANVGFRVVLAPLRAPSSRPSPSLAWIEPGEFLMGSPAGELGRQEDEAPRTQVTLTEGFFMGRYEVTQAEYEAVMGNNPSWNKSYDDQPVDQVTWSDAMQFCQKLTGLEQAAGRIPDGYSYRLPTEAEWEYAARAGSSSRFSYGDDPNYEILGNYAWYFEGATTHQAGAKLPNAWGLYDIMGNVWEWCADDYLEYAGGKAVNPVASGSSSKVMRGGSAFDSGEWCRSACRMDGETNAAYQNVGFRVVLARDPLPMALDPEMIWVPAGAFRMGSPLSEQDRESDEGPMNVTISHGYWLGKYEVSQAEYAAFMGTNTSHYKGWNHRPVEQVTWDEAVEFCRRLTELKRDQLPQGYVFRLPTEAEWEYAARAGAATRFCYGDDLQETGLSEYAHFLVGPTGGIGGKQPNAWGFHDMHGNVYEWCLDRYVEYSGGVATDPWIPLSTNQLAVCRGGSIADDAKYCRSAFRNYGGRSDRDSSVGFRLALGRENLTPDFEPVTLVAIPAGQFLMGSPTNEVGYEMDESPQTQVIISSGFWMSAYEITQAQYCSLMSTNPSWFATYGNLPVEQVTWEESNEFCRKLTEHEKQAGRLPSGYVYRLPTEAEWEYAARAGSTNRFSFGDDPSYQLLSDYAWHKFISAGVTHGVGAKLPNSWGLYDIHGNVAEWCLDGYGPYPGGQVTDPAGPLDAEYRVMRGGSFFDTGELCRSAFRLYDWTGDRFYNVGFRVVLARLK